MTSFESSQLPNLGELFGQVLQRVSAQEQPLLIAIAERLAADRYRVWAAGATNPTHSAQLVACADREEEIACHIEALFPNASGVQAEIRARNPDLEDLNRSIFANRPLHQQFAIQAQGERLGAATWRAFAQAEKDERARQTLLACAALEEASALILESILATGTA